MSTFLFLAIVIFGVIPGFSWGWRVVGGSETVITKYPSTAVILEYVGHHLVQKCGGTIINEKHILTAAHCIDGSGRSANPEVYRVRVGSSAAHTGGSLHLIKSLIVHPKWNCDTQDNDIGLMRIATDIAYSYTKKPAVLAGSNYRIQDNDIVWATGWGFITERGPASEILRHVHVRVVNQEICQERYGDAFKITDNMMCSGWLDVGGGDQCTHDSGSPIYHNGTVVGIASTGVGCGEPGYPAVNVRVSRFTDWILAITGTAIVLPPPKLIVNLRLTLSLP